MARLRSARSPALAFLVLLLVNGLSGGAVRVAFAQGADPAALSRDGQSGTADVRLRTGELIAGAAYTVDPRFKTLRLKGETGERIVSFADVEAVIVGGQDRTVEVLGAQYGRRAPAAAPTPNPVASPSDATAPLAEAAPESAVTTPAPVPGGTWLSENDETYRRARTPLWKLAVGAAANFSAPFGEYYDGTKAGPGYEGCLLAALTRQIALRFGVSRSGMDWGDELAFAPLDPDLVVLGQDLGLRVLRYYIAVQAAWPRGGDGRGRSMWYAYAGAGAVQHRLTVELDVRDTATDERYVLRDHDDQTKFLTTMGGGLVQPLSPSLALDIAASVDQVWVGARSETGTYYPAGSMGYVIDLKFGILAFF